MSDENNEASQRGLEVAVERIKGHARRVRVMDEFEEVMREPPINGPWSRWRNLTTGGFEILTRQRAPVTSIQDPTVAALIASAPDLAAENQRLRERVRELEREFEEAEFIHHEGGEESVAALVAENKRLRELLEECADDIEDTAITTYPEANRQRSAQDLRNWEAEMDLVKRARAALKGDE